MNNHDMSLMKDRVWELVRAHTGLGVRQYTVNHITVRVAERIHTVFSEDIRLDVQEHINR